MEPEDWQPAGEDAPVQRSVVRMNKAIVHGTRLDNRAAAELWDLCAGGLKKGKLPSMNPRISVATVAQASLAAQQFVETALEAVQPRKIRKYGSSIAFAQGFDS